MGITIFKIFIWEVYRRIAVKLISDRISDDLPPQNEKFDYSYPLIYTLEDMLDVLNLSIFPNSTQIPETIYVPGPGITMPP